MIPQYYTHMKYLKVRLDSQDSLKRSLWSVSSPVLEIKILDKYSGTPNTCVIIGKIKSPSSGGST